MFKIHLLQAKYLSILLRFRAPEKYANAAKDCGQKSADILQVIMGTENVVYVNLLLLQDSLV